jgi:ABC-type Fe3+ transport system substrate-binding protein
VVRMNRGISTVTGALLILVIVLAAVGAYGFLRPAPQVTYTPGTTEERASIEGSLTIYGVIDTTDFTSVIIPAFEKEYPWAKGKINYVGLSPSEISTRGLSEFKAGKVQADLLIDTLGSLTSALIGGAAENYKSPMVSLMNYTEGTYDPSGLWTVGYGLPIVVAYNTKLVDPSKVPKTWDDLTNSYWNGKIALDDPKTLNVAGSLFAHLYPILGDAKWKTLMQGIAANHPVLTQSAGDSFTKVAQGEVYVATGLINDYLAGKKLSPPISVEIAWIPPVTTLPIVTALAKNAPHPNFAKLFIEWFASAAGQYAIANTGRVPMHPAIAAGTILAGVLPPGTSIAGVASNNPDYYSNPTKWATMYQGIFG